MPDEGVLTESTDTETAIVTSAKKWLRNTSDAFNEEIEQTVDACLLDLKNSGVENRDTTDALIQQAIKLYCKAQFGYNDMGDKFQKSYEFLKAALALSGDYNTEADDA